MVSLTKTIEKKYYVAFDGTEFENEDDCRKYEKEAESIEKEKEIIRRFKRLMINEPFSECYIFDDFGYGSEEYMLCVIELKDEVDVNDANNYRLLKGVDECFTKEDIGKRFLIELGFEFDNYDVCRVRGTYDDLVKDFMEKVKRVYYTKTEWERMNANGKE